MFESHDEHIHDSKTLKPALDAAQPFKLAVVDRGYRGAKQYVEAEVLLPGEPLKRDSEYEQQKKRILENIIDLLDYGI